jgi:hypothetical protein
MIKRIPGLTGPNAWMHLCEQMRRWPVVSNAWLWLHEQMHSGPVRDKL